MIHLISATFHVLATILGNIVGGWIADKWGKKLTMFTFNLLTLTFWLISACAHNKYLLYSSYSLQGLFGAIAHNCVGKTFLELPSGVRAG